MRKSRERVLCSSGQSWARIRTATNMSGECRSSHFVVVVVVFNIYLFITFYSAGSSLPHAVFLWLWWKCWLPSNGLCKICAILILLKSGFSVYVFNSNAYLCVLLQRPTGEGSLKYPVNQPSIQLIRQVFTKPLLCSSWCSRCLGYISTWNRQNQ